MMWWCDDGDGDGDDDDDHDHDHDDDDHHDDCKCEATSGLGRTCQDPDAPRLGAWPDQLQ